ncbi:MAG: hypothetical protein INQ03_25950 [Candidatus Heimdallarchaeota archaeon]|nr:hypothetical protein [Candidatus Heimdallarchaeota archaeon]
MVTRSVLMIVLISMFILPVSGETPIIRIVSIDEISLLGDIEIEILNGSEMWTEFEIIITYEAANENSESVYITANCICYPTIWVYPSFENENYTSIISNYGGFQAVTRYEYSPGITTEQEVIHLAINESGLQYLPKGNYTLKHESYASIKTQYNATILSDGENYSIVYDDFPGYNLYTSSENSSTIDFIVPVLPIIGFIWVITIIKQRKK